MFDDNHIDDSSLFRSILENASEEVPERVWQGVSDELDRIARRRTTVLWFRRVAVTSAAAAAVALTLILNRGTEDTIVPAATDKTMIAVVETSVESVDEAEVPATEPQTIEQIAKTIGNKTAMVEFPKERPTAEVIPEGTDNDIETVSDSEPEVTKPRNVEGRSNVSDSDYTEQPFEEDWLEDEPQKSDKVKASLVVSGIAGTNNPQSKGSLKPFRSPVIEKAYKKTTVEQTSTNTIYGIPVSLGTGVKLDFNKHWSLGIGLNYTLLTSKFNGKYIKVDEAGNPETPISANIRNAQHYIGIPINAYYNIMSHDFINFYAYAGGAVEKCILNKYEVQTSPMIIHKEDPKGVQLSANLGVGVEFMINRYLGIYIDPSLRYYFKCDQAKSIRTAQPLMLGFEMGFRFNL